MGKLSDADKIEVVSRYLNGESCGKISLDFPVNRDAIRKILIARNIKTRNRNEIRVHKFDEHFFDIIDTENKAYWLGFIVADGNVFNTTLCIELEAKDKEHLEKFAKDIKYEYYEDFRPSKNSFRIRLNSKHLVQALKKLGVIPKKSYKIKIPSIDKELMSHFLRGFFDGDGCLFSKLEERRITWTFRIASVCLSFLSDYKLLIEYYLRTESGSIYEHSLTWTGNWNVLKVVNIIYADANIYLDRKHNIALEFIEYMKTRKKNKWGK